MKTRKLALLAILIALSVAISFFYIPVGENLRIYFTFLVTMMVAANFKMSECLLFALIEDIVSFFIYPTGPFFAGYTLTAILSIAIYRIFLYKKVNFLNVFISKGCVNIFVNVLLGSLWSYILYSNAYLYYVTKSIIKNLIMWPIETLMFLAIYKLIQPLFNSYFKKQN